MPYLHLLRNKYKLQEAIRYYYNKWLLHRDLRHYKNLERLILTEDTGYLHKWDISDYDKIKREYDLVRTGKVRADNIIRILNRLYQDQTVYYTNTIEPISNKEISIRKSRDKITDAILRHWAKVHVGKSFETIQYACIGTDNAVTPTSNDTDLVNEVARLHIYENGGHLDAIGKTEFYGVLFSPSGLATNDIGEAGLATTASAVTDLLACREIYNPKIVHVINQDGVGINFTFEHKGF